MRPITSVRSFPSLTAAARGAAFPFRTFLPDGVMVAQATLTRLVMVRIHVGQPFDAWSKPRLLNACGRRGGGYRDALRRTMGFVRNRATFGFQSASYLVADSDVGNSTVVSRCLQEEWRGRFLCPGIAEWQIFETVVKMPGLRSPFS